MNIFSIYENGAKMACEGLGLFLPVVGGNFGCGDFANGMQANAAVLAAGSTDPAAIGSWMLVLATVLGIAVAAKTLLAKPKELPHPLPVKMEDHFVTRREFDDARRAQERDIAKLEGMAARIFEKIDERDTKLTENIERLSQTTMAAIKESSTQAYNGRARLHENLNQVRDRVAKVEERAEICPRLVNCEKQRS